MKTKHLKNKIMLITTIIFGFLTLFFNIYLYYVKSKEQEHHYLEKEKNLKSLLIHIEKNIDSTITNRLATMSKFDYFQDFKKDLQNNTFIYRDKNIERLEFHFNNFKLQIPTMRTLHIVDSRGYSYIRMHDKNLYKDKVADLRPSILKMIKNPQDISYLEYGACGLKYRIAHPIYNDEIFLGFIEVGIEPTFLPLAIKELSSHESFIFIKEKHSNHFSAPDTINKEFEELLQDSLLSHVSIDKKTYAKYEFIFEDIENKPVIKVVVLEDITESKRLFFNFFLISILISIFLMFSLLIVLDRFFNTILSRIDELLYLINNTDDFIIVVDATTKKIKFANTHVYKLFHKKEQELKSLTIEKILIPIVKESNFNHILFERNTHKAVIKRAYLRVDEEHAIPLEMSINFIQRDGGHYVIIAKNIAGQLELELQKRVNESMINKYIPLSHTDLRGTITYVNSAFCTLSGYTQEELLGNNHSLLKSSKTPPEIYEALWGTITQDKTFRTELRLLKKDGSEIWVKILIEPRYDIHAKKIGYVSTREDVTDKQRLKFVSEHDVLTKAFNRRSFESKLAQILESAYKYNKTFGLIMFDIDHFKKVNDTYGHQVGDEILMKLSAVLQKTIRENDFFARWGGEEFVIIVPNQKEEELVLIIEKIQENLAHTDFSPVEKITSSFGATLYKYNDTKESILLRVDNALYKAKELGRNRYEID